LVNIRLTKFDILQETALNHVKTAGLLGDGFGATPEMSKRNLIWVVSKIQLLVERYPSWYFSSSHNCWMSFPGKSLLSSLPIQFISLATLAHSLWWWYFFPDGRCFLSHFGKYQSHRGLIFILIPYNSNNELNCLSAISFPV
jgi:hypothetical protein